jgi:hypothetical protein
MQLIPLASIDEVERVRFEENARTAQKLDNTNLAKVFDVGVQRRGTVLAVLPLPPALGTTPSAKHAFPVKLTCYYLSLSHARGTVRERAGT